MFITWNWNLLNLSESNLFIRNLLCRIIHSSILESWIVEWYRLKLSEFNLFYHINFRILGCRELYWLKLSEKGSIGGFTVQHPSLRADFNPFVLFFKIDMIVLVLKLYLLWSDTICTRKTITKQNRWLKLVRWLWKAYMSYMRTYLFR